MIKKLICYVFGHRYFVIMRFGSGCRKVGCARCGNKWGMHDATRSFVEWDSELDELHGLLGDESTKQ